jgi:hypothetical protein
MMTDTKIEKHLHGPPMVGSGCPRGQPGRPNGETPATRGIPAHAPAGPRQAPEACLRVPAQGEPPGSVERERADRSNVNTPGSLMVKAGIEMVNT